MLAEHWDEGAERTVLGPGVIPVLTESPGTIRNAGSARPGQHNEEIYTGLLGKTTAELDALRSEGCCEHIARPGQHPRGGTA